MLPFTAHVDKEASRHLQERPLPPVPPGRMLPPADAILEEQAAFPGGPGDGVEAAEASDGSGEADEGGVGEAVGHQQDEGGHGAGHH